MRETDARIYYLEDTVPYKNSYMTVQIYESNQGQDVVNTLEINLTLPENGDGERVSKHIKVKFDE